MARKLPSKDVAIIGLGWTGSILANELTDAGLDVVAIERGPWRNTATDYPPGYVADELRYRIRHELFLRPEQTTFTLTTRTSIPRRIGPSSASFLRRGKGQIPVTVAYRSAPWRASSVTRGSPP